MLGLARSCKARPRKLGRATVAQPPKFFYAALSKQPMYDGVVSLEGASAGKFFNDADLNIEPTIDISDLAHVVLDDPAPRNNSAANRIKAGDVCQASDSAGNTFLCIAAAVQDLQPEPRIFGYVRLDGAQCGDITTNVSSQLYIGRAAVVPLDGHRD
jgi:hypothetical protein